MPRIPMFTATAALPRDSGQARGSTDLRPIEGAGAGFAAIGKIADALSRQRIEMATGFVNAALADYAEVGLHGLGTLKGSDAADQAAPAYLDTLDRVAADLAARAPNPLAGEAFSAQAGGLRAGFAKHALTAGRLAELGRGRAGLQRAADILAETASALPDALPDLLVEGQGVATRARALLPENEAATFGAATRERIASSAARALIAADPGAATRAFDAGGFDGVLGTASRARLRQVAEGAVADRDRRRAMAEAGARMETSRAVTERLIDLRARIAQGEAGFAEVEDAYRLGEGWLDSRTRARLHEYAVSLGAATASRAARLERVDRAFTGEEPIDHDDPSDMAALADHFAAFMAGGASAPGGADFVDPDMAERAAHYCITGRCIPPQIRKTLPRQLESPEATIVVEAARLIGILTGADLGDRLDLPPAQVLYAQEVEANRAAGYSPDQAVEAARQRANGGISLAAGPAVVPLVRGARLGREAVRRVGPPLIAGLEELLDRVLNEASDDDPETNDTKKKKASTEAKEDTARADGPALADAPPDTSPTRIDEASPDQSDDAANQPSPSGGSNRPPLAPFIPRAIEEAVRRFDQTDRGEAGTEGEAVPGSGLESPPDRDVDDAEAGTGLRGSQPFPDWTELKTLRPDDPDFFEVIDGRTFLKGTKGSGDLSELPDLESYDDDRRTLPVRLHRKDLHHVDNATHREIARNLGYNNGVELSVDVAENWTEVRRGEKGRYLLIKKNGKNAVAVVEAERVSSDNGYWRIVTTGTRSASQPRDLVLSRERTSAPTAD